MTRRTEFAALLLLVAVLAGSLAGCAGAAVPPVAVVAAPRPLPDGVHDPADAPSATSKPANPSGCPDARASFRPGPATGTKVEAIRARKTVRVGVGQTAYLMAFRDPVSGALSGFEIDLVKEIATALLGDPGKVTYVSLDPRDWKAALEVDEKGDLLDKNGADVDMVLGAMTMSCERWATWAFSTEYLPAGQRVLVRKDSGFDRIEDLGGRKVCASTGSTNLAHIRERTATNGKPIGVVSANTETECMLLLQAGVVDAVSTDDVILAGLAAQDKNTQVVGGQMVDEPCGIGMRRSDVDLIRFVNGVLAHIRGDDLADRSATRWQQIYNSWLGPDLGPQTAPAPHYRD